MAKKPLKIAKNHAESVRSSAKVSLLDIYAEIVNIFFPDPRTANRFKGEVMGLADAILIGKVPELDPGEVAVFIDERVRALAAISGKEQAKQIRH